MKKHLTFIVALLVVTLGATAQTINVHMTNGETVKYSAEEVSYIDFTPDTSVKPVDLALPSGTLWAPMNIGASKPEEAGIYVAWGETAEKSEYTWETYTHCDEGNSWKCHDLGMNIAGTEYDAATANWGSDWQMPTLEQVEELIANCTMESVTVNEVKCWKYTGTNGSSILLPVAGRNIDKALSSNDYGYYWTATRYEYNDRNAELLYIGGRDTNKSLYQSRYCGFTVRAVRKPQTR